MEVKVCPKCGKHNSYIAWNCINCGETLSATTIIDSDNIRLSPKIPLKPDKVEVRDENFELGERLSILIHATLFIFGTLFILFKVQGIWENVVGWKNPIWPYFLVGTVLMGLIYYLDIKILPGRSNIMNIDSYSSAGLISGLVLTLGLGIPALLGTFILMDVSSIFLIVTAPVALISFIMAIILIKRLGNLFS